MKSTDSEVSRSGPRIFVLLGLMAVSGVALLYRAAADPAAPQQGRAPAIVAVGEGAQRVALAGGLDMIERVERTDGEVAAVLRAYKRDGVIVMRYAYHPSLDTGMRLYYAAGRPVLYEEFDGEGNVTMLVSHGPDGEADEVFVRDADGSTIPASGQVNDEFKRGAALIDDLFGPIAEAVQEGDQEEAKQRISESVETIEANRRDQSGPREAIVE